MPRPSLTTPRKELEALGETLRNLIAQAYTLHNGRGTIRPDSELAASCAMGIITSALNRELAAEVHRLYNIQKTLHLGG